MAVLKEKRRDVHLCRELAAPGCLRQTRHAHDYDGWLRSEPISQWSSLSVSEHLFESEERGLAIPAGHVIDRPAMGRQLCSSASCSALAQATFDLVSYALLAATLFATLAAAQCRARAGGWASGTGPAQCQP
jgi:hypothetical protein